MSSVPRLILFSSSRHCAIGASSDNSAARDSMSSSTALHRNSICSNGVVRREDLDSLSINSMNRCERFICFNHCVSLSIISGVTDCRSVTAVLSVAAALLSFLIAVVELFFGLVMALLFCSRLSTNDSYYTSKRFERWSYPAYRLRVWCVVTRSARVSGMLIIVWTGKASSMDESWRLGLLPLASLYE